MSSECGCAITAAPSLFISGGPPQREMVWSSTTAGTQMGIASARGATPQTLSDVMKAVTSHSAETVRQPHSSANPEKRARRSETVWFPTMNRSTLCSLGGCI